MNMRKTVYKHHTISVGMVDSLIKPAIEIGVAIFETM